jgi:hypothetical protein
MDTSVSAHSRSGSNIPAGSRSRSNIVGGRNAGVAGENDEPDDALQLALGVDVGEYEVGEGAYDVSDER